MLKFKKTKKKLMFHYTQTHTHTHAYFKNKFGFFEKFRCFLVVCYCLYCLDCVFLFKIDWFVVCVCFVVCGCVLCGVCFGCYFVLCLIFFSFETFLGRYYEMFCDKINCIWGIFVFFSFFCFVFYVIFFMFFVVSFCFFLNCGFLFKFKHFGFF